MRMKESGGTDYAPDPHPALCYDFGEDFDSDSEFEGDSGHDFEEGEQHISKFLRVW